MQYFLPPPQSDGLTAGKGCNDLFKKQKQKQKTKPPLEQPTQLMTFHSNKWSNANHPAETPLPQTFWVLVAFFSSEK